MTVVGPVLLRKVVAGPQFGSIIIYITTTWRAMTETRRSEPMAGKQGIHHELAWEKTRNKKSLRDDDAALEGIARVHVHERRLYARYISGGVACI